MSRCICHSADIYLTLAECPKCGHWSLDQQGDWEACERRRCGYESVLTIGGEVIRNQMTWEWDG